MDRGIVIDGSSDRKKEMLSREAIILMIEKMDFAAEQAQRELDNSIRLLRESDNLIEVAAGQQLKAAVMDGIMVQSSNQKDMTAIYEVAKRTKAENDMILVTDILFWRNRLKMAIAFTRIWTVKLNGRYQAVLEQRYKEGKAVKEIRYKDHELTRYEIEKACTEGIRILQEEMKAQDFREWP